MQCDTPLSQASQATGISSSRLSGASQATGVSRQLTDVSMMARKSSRVEKTNGFATMPEPQSLAIRPENIAPYTMPAGAFTFVTPPEAKMATYKNGDKERKIFCNIEISEMELEHLKALQILAKKNGLTFFPAVSVMASRFLSRSHSDASKALGYMKATQAWRQEYFSSGPIHDTDVLEDLQHGIVYFAGRDSALRPCIVVRACRIPEKWYKEKRLDKLIRMLIFCMEYMLQYMLVPGVVENNCLVVDLKGLSMTQVPISALKDIYKVVGSHYMCRVFRFYVCNMSSGLGMIAGLATRILTDRQKQKLVFVDDIKVLRKDFALHQLETDLGGTREIDKVFFPFPLPAGPFEAGYDKGPDPKELKGAHTVLSPEFVQGHLWEAKHSAEENTRLEYSVGAFAYFDANGLAVPPECRRQHEAREAKLRAAAEAELEWQQQEEAERAKLAADGVSSMAVEMASETPAAIKVLEFDAQSDASSSIQEDVVIKPGGFFSCTSCVCANR